jgi:ribosomal RNA-processing protein 36
LIITKKNQTYKHPYYCKKQKQKIRIMAKSAALMPSSSPSPSPSFSKKRKLKATTKKTKTAGARPMDDKDDDDASSNYDSSSSDDASDDDDDDGDGEPSRAAVAAAVTNFDDLPTDDSDAMSSSDDDDSSSDSDNKETKKKTKSQSKSSTSTTQTQELSLKEQISEQRNQGRKLTASQKETKRVAKEEAVKLAKQKLREQRYARERGAQKKHEKEEQDHTEIDSATDGQTKINRKKKKSKHAPVEVSSKQIDFYERGGRTANLGASGLNAEVLGLQDRYKSRDPRMSEMVTSKSSIYKAEQDYAFLDEKVEDEITLYKKRLKARKLKGSGGQRARKQLGIGGSGEEVDQQQAESDKEHLQQLTQQRAERVRTQSQRAAKFAIKQTVSTQVAEHGAKAVFYPKKRDQKDQLLAATYDELRKRGGNRAVDKALAKKRQKNAQKDHRNMPSKLSQSQEPLSRR